MKEHNWIMVLTTSLTSVQAAEFRRLGHITDKAVVANPPAVGCYDCELEINECWGKPCLVEKREEE